MRHSVLLVPTPIQQVMIIIKRISWVEYNHTTSNSTCFDLDVYQRDDFGVLFMQALLHALGHPALLDRTGSAVRGLKRVAYAISRLL